MIYSLEMDVYNKLRYYITDHLHLNLTYEHSMSAGRDMPDILIYNGGLHIAAIDVKIMAHLRGYEDAKARIRQIAFANNYLLAVVTNGEQFYVCDTSSSSDADFEEKSLEEFAAMLEDVKPLIDERERCVKHREDFIKAFTEAANECLQDNPTANFKRNRNVVRFANGCRETDLIVIDGKLQFFDVKKENEFFEQLVESFTDETVYRFTSLDSIFRTLESSQQSMCCLVGMNDRSEVNYADNYLNQSVVKTAYDKKKENNYFILSCVEDDDNESLTMWRLYGDNTRGVRITYEPQSMPDGFRFGKIYYGDSINHHAGLEFLKKVLSTKMGNVFFRFNHFDYWKHFFKPFDYAIEREVRLLYEKCSSNPPQIVKWIKIGEFSVLAPLAIFNAKAFSLKIKEIRLGPNMKEQRTNMLQLKELCVENGFMSEAEAENRVITSRIDHYRI